MPIDTTSGSAPVPSWQMQFPGNLAWSNAALTGVRGARTDETEAALDRITTRLGQAGRRYGMPSRIGELATFRSRGCTFLYYPVEWLLENALRELKCRLPV